MKIQKRISRLLAAAALLTALAAVWFCFTPGEPVLLGTPEGAMEQARGLMDAVCRGDYDRAGELLWGSPRLGLDREPADPVGQVLWEGFQESLQYEFPGACYASDRGVAWDLRLTRLKFASVTEPLGDRSRQLLEQRVAQARDVSEVYDENNEYREDVAREVLVEAAWQALEEDAETETLELTLHLVYEDGQWWVLPERDLLNAISWGAWS